MQKLETTRFDLSKLSNVVKNEVVKKTEYHELVKKVNAIRTTDTNNLVQKLTITQTLMEFKKMLLVIIVISMLLSKNL